MRLKAQQQPLNGPREEMVLSMTVIVFDYNYNSSSNKSILCVITAQARIIPFIWVSLVKQEISASYWWLKWEYQWCEGCDFIKQENVTLSSTQTKLIHPVRPSPCYLLLSPDLCSHLIHCNWRYVHCAVLECVVMGVMGCAVPSVTTVSCPFSSGPGVQRTEPSGDHRGGVGGRPHHAALHGSGSAHLEEVDMNTHV